MFRHPESLEAEALEPDALRAAVGSAVRSLGEEGKKKGHSTTLPLALGQLQAGGEIRRIPVNGRIDQQRYKYMLWASNPRSGCATRAIDAYTELAAGTSDGSLPRRSPSINVLRPKR